ncbi:MAG: glucokinase [Gemmatimonadaceae bacterium]
MILACDVGGTKTNVALVTASDSRWQTVRFETYRSREHASLHDIMAAFLGASPPALAAAGFGVAGPVIDHRVTTTNLPWNVDGGAIATQLGVPRVSLLNDLEAFAWGVPELGATDQLVLQTGVPDGGNLAVIAAGSGLGVSALIRGTGTVRSLASEGGHADFSPVDDTDIALLQFLRRRFGRVSAERVLSGPGLVNVYEFLRHEGGYEEPEPIDTSAAHAASDIAGAALSGRSELAEQAVLRFLAAYGGAAGNWALSTLATGGVWLGGGIAHKLLSGPPGTPSGWKARARDAFLTRFRSKGRFSPLLDAMPVHVILTEIAPLMGAARFALNERNG